MIYSVWKPKERVYHYYNVGEAFTDDTPAPRAKGAHKLGAVPANISWTLPAGARRVGQGSRARGAVIHEGVGGSGGLVSGLSGFEDIGWTPVVLLAAAAILMRSALK